MGVLVDPGRAVPAGGSGQAFQLVLLLARVKADLLVAGWHAILRWFDPNLKEVYWLLLGSVVFTVQHAGPGGHALNFVGPENLFVPHTIPMGERSLQDI